MVNFCCVVGCSNRSTRDRDLSFYCIPKILEHQGEHSQKVSKQRRERWLANIKRSGWEPAKHSRVCSTHFISGKPSLLHAENHPDWAPTQRMGYNNSTASSSLQGHDRKRKHKHKRKRKADDAAAASALIELRQTLQPATDVMQQHEEQDTNKAHSGCQTDMLSQDVSLLLERCKRLEQENIALRTEVQDLRDKCKSSGLSEEDCVEDTVHRIEILHEYSVSDIFSIAHPAVNMSKTVKVQPSAQVCSRTSENTPKLV